LNKQKKKDYHIKPGLNKTRRNFCKRKICYNLYRQNSNICHTNHQWNQANNL